MTPGGEGKDKLEPLRLTSQPGAEGESTFLVMNDETGNPEMWTEKEVELNRRFNALLAAVPRPTVTIALIALNLTVFLAMIAAGVSLTKPTASDILRWGADYGPLTTHGQWWRLLTSAFLHFGIVHLLMNMLFLGIIGRFAERVFGHAAFAALYLLAGIGGNLASLYWQPAIVGAGASGAIFGIYGGVLGFVLLQPNLVPGHRVRSIGRAAAVFVAYQLIYGFSSNLFGGNTGTRIDLAAHIGGAVSGLLVGGALTRVRFAIPPERRTAMTALALAAATLLAVLLAWRLPVYDDYRAAIEQFGNSEKAALKLYSELMSKVMTHKISPADFQQALDRQVLAPWNAERDRLSKMRFPKDQQAIAAKLERYMALRAKAWSLFGQGIATGNPRLLTEGLAAQKEVQALMREIVPAPARPASPTPGRIPVPRPAIPR